MPQMNILDAPCVYDLKDLYRALEENDVKDLENLIGRADDVKSR